MWLGTARVYSGELLQLLELLEWEARNHCCVTKSLCRKTVYATGGGGGLPLPTRKQTVFCRTRISRKHLPDPTEPYLTTAKKGWCEPWPWCHGHLVTVCCANTLVVIHCNGTCLATDSMWIGFSFLWIFFSALMYISLPLHLSEICEGVSPHLPLTFLCTCVYFCAVVLSRALIRCHIVAQGLQPPDVPVPDSRFRRRRRRRLSRR